MAASSSVTAPTEPLLTGDQVAGILGITPRTVRRMAAAGELRRIRLGRRTTRYMLEDVESLIQRSQVPLNDVEPVGNGLDVKEGDDTAHASAG